MGLIKKASLLAVAAVAAAALAAPAGAAAAEWTQEGEPLTENTEVTLGGQVEYSGLFGSIGCFTTIEATLEPGGTGTVDSYKTNFNFCQAGGFMAMCFFAGEKLVPEGLPWPLSVENSSEIGLSEIELVSTFGPGCPYYSKLVFTGSVQLTPANPESISTVSLSGTLAGTTGKPVEASGTLSAEPAGVYGIQ